MKTKIFFLILATLVALFSSTRAIAQESEDSAAIKGLFFVYTGHLSPLPESDPLSYCWVLHTSTDNEYEGGRPSTAQLAYNISMDMGQEPIWLGIKTVNIRYLDWVYSDKEFDSTILKKMISKVYFQVQIFDAYEPVYRITKVMTNNEYWPKVYDKTVVISGKRLDEDNIILKQHEEISNLYTPSFVKYWILILSFFFFWVLVFLSGLITIRKEKEELVFNRVVFAILMGAIIVTLFREGEDYIGAGLSLIFAAALFALEIYLHKVLKRKLEKKALKNHLD